jgi:hypothetical protein
MPEKKLTPRQHTARMLLNWAQRLHQGKRGRQRSVWFLLLEWASYGGKPEEEIHD